MRGLFFILMAFAWGCCANKNDIAKQQAGINSRMEALYKRYAALNDSEKHIIRPLQIPADTISFMDSINLITDTAIGKMEIDIWQKIRALQHEYYSLEAGER